MCVFAVIVILILRKFKEEKRMIKRKREVLYKSADPMH